MRTVEGLPVRFEGEWLLWPRVNRFHGRLLQLRDQSVVPKPHGDAVRGPHGVGAGAGARTRTRARAQHLSCHARLLEVA